jgi:hypothetical protein
MTTSFYLALAFLSFHPFNRQPTLLEIQVKLMTHDIEPQSLLEAFIRLIQNLSLQITDHVRNDCATLLEGV